MQTTSAQKVRKKRAGTRQTKTTRVSVYEIQENFRNAKKQSEDNLEWLRYFRHGSSDVRARLLKRYLPLVRNVAGRMAIGFPRSVELTDLINTGVIGLVEAFKNFDPARGVKFETYAVPRIRGAILDELRALDWVPRSTRARSREIERAVIRLENDFGRRPTEVELAKALGYSVRELHMAISDVSCTSLLSLDEAIYKEEDNHQVPRIETVSEPNRRNALGDLEKNELQAFLAVAIDRLTDQEKLVIALYYFEELTLKEIGEVMSISESRVSQIHTKAVLKLRGMIKERFAMSG
ncbi:MAG: RNA polymerase sigma factor WhiG [Candidatus Zixiibacteriota bacterium]|nr:MAG: RNA polymerase sigma factor WhiG [candidate division Zixibacteria bacterium]HDL03580.1 FliA/WhiG family RNA polymerase sigma factor [candidate division Zixibacteria bacterium]